MAKKQKLKYDNDPWKMVIYIIAVLVLIGCLAFIVYTRRQHQKSYQEELLKLQLQETEYVRPARETETETEQETESAAKQKPASAAVEEKH